MAIYILPGLWVREDEFIGGETYDEAVYGMESGDTERQAPSCKIVSPGLREKR